jgi:hypothetical protein
VSFFENVLSQSHNIIFVGFFLDHHFQISETDSINMD